MTSERSKLIMRMVINRSTREQTAQENDRQAVEAAIDDLFNNSTEITNYEDQQADQVFVEDNLYIYTAKKDNEVCYVSKQIDFLDTTTCNNIGVNENNNKYSLSDNMESKVCQIVTKRLVNYSASEDDSDFSTNDSVSDPSFYLQRDATFHISDSDEDQENVKTPTRWRKRNPSGWKVNISKSNKSKSLPYRNKYKDCLAKRPKEVDCTNCRFNCNNNFTEQQRKDICRSFWALADNKRQKDFLIKYVQVVTPKRRKVDANSSRARSVSKVYYLPNNKERLRVCAKFFEGTLCISNGPINTAIQGIDSQGFYQGVDRRGRKIPGNKTTEEQLELIKHHIESFPSMESHYVRQTSKRKYLDSKLSVLKMYEMYTELCKNQEVNPVSEFTYRRIFCTSYNLSFFKPKKDQCPTCSKYEVADNIRKAELELDYSMHIIRKNECNEAKESDKARCLNESSFLSANFDLQSVLQIPYSDVSQFYYSRKICVYNLTIYEGDGTNAYCYCWNELNGKRGSNEIGSILLHYIEHLPTHVEEISLFSDTCGGQNRNQQVAAVLLHAVKNTHLKVIHHKFLESGHSHMECDSMHSAIEKSKRNRTAFMMNDWKQIFEDARSNRSSFKQPKNKKTPPKSPYKVIEMKYSDFKDLSKLASLTIKNRNKDEDGNTVSWLKIKNFTFNKEFPDIIFYRYDHCSELKKIVVSGRGRRHSNNVESLQPAYKAQLPISAQKKEDLLKLCRSDLIPDELKGWYENLPTSANITERLPEPDLNESEIED